jgi:hypothetical protein
MSYYAHIFADTPRQSGSFKACLNSSCLSAAQHSNPYALALEFLLVLLVNCRTLQEPYLLFAMWYGLVVGWHVDQVKATASSAPSETFQAKSS